MTTSKRKQANSLSSFGSIYDAVHGPIDIRESGGSPEMRGLVGLLNTPMMDRLRRIKQLGYASHNYLSADHNRYAHALGTMHVMRTMLRHLNARGETFSTTLASLKSFAAPKVDTYAKIVRHMLVAALLQDIGELPYSQATGYVYRPNDELRKRVMTSVDLEIYDWSDKNVYTIASIYDEPYCRQLGLNLSFITFLITNHLENESNRTEELNKLRHMLDGEVDADRLDYVFRDAHHTIGARGTPNAVIDSLLYYDGRGPVFSDPGPVSDFLATRASLWTTVYFSPQNRFRTLLLVTLLQGITENDACSNDFFGKDFRGELSLEDFTELDDVSLNTRIKNLGNNKDLKKRLNDRAQNALDALLGRAAEYECVWLPRKTSDTVSSRQLNIPADLFFDTYSHYQENHTVYDLGTIHVEAERFKYDKNPVPLEECCGAFREVFKRPMSIVEKPGSILLFMPKVRSNAGWEQIQRSIKEDRLYETLMDIDPVGHLNLPDDTRNRKGYKDPHIFISFAGADKKIVQKVAQALLLHRRKYYVYNKSFKGLGGTPGRNSIEAVEKAGAVIMLTSENYVKRFHEAADGNVAKEVYAISKRVKNENLPLVILSADDFQEINLPWAEFGYTEPGFVGEPLRNATSKVVREAIDEVLKVIDGE